MRNIILTFILLGFISNTKLSAQNEQEVKTVQPSIMLIPMVKEGQDMRTIIESEFNIRVGFTKINEAFNQRGFSTVDFRAKMKQILDEQGIEMVNQQSYRQMLFENNLADIIVEFDMAIMSTGSAKEVVINLNATDNKGATTLSSEICRSGQWSGVDISKLTEKAIESKIEVFLNTMNSKFDDIVNDGLPIIAMITFSESSDLNMFSEVGNEEEELGRILRSWFKDNAYKNYCNIEYVLETKMKVNPVKIPLKDSNGFNYDIFAFSDELYDFLKTNNVKARMEPKGNALYITIK